MDHQHHQHHHPAEPQMEHSRMITENHNSNHGESHENLVKMPHEMGGDMGHMSGHSMGDMMMMMYFHGGFNEVILFDFWRISTLAGLIGSMVGCFIMGVLYEGIKSYREHWMNGAFHAVNYNQVGNQQRKPPGVEQGVNANGESSRTGDNISDQDSVKIIETKMISLAHFVLTALHMVQMTLAYFLMLIVMTYNTWLCLSVIFGSTLGYFLFGWRKTTVVDVSDHCH
jgi:copper transporter 1